MLDHAHDKQKLTFCYDLPRQLPRFRELIIYIADKCRRAEYFGATKLNKILYRADFESYRRFGTPITGVIYFRLPKGPAPKILLPIRDDLAREGAITVEKHGVGNRVQHRIIPLRKPYLDDFTRDELALVDEIIEQMWGQTADEVSDASHDIRWRTLNDRDPIPYESAFLSDEPITDEDINLTNRLADEHGWNGY